jgi:DNA-binding Lrp family transcriptional regulator
MHDEIGIKLLKELQANARATFADLGRAVGPMPPAAAERVRRLEEEGLIRGYRADVDFPKPATRSPHSFARRSAFMPDPWRI